MWLLRDDKSAPLSVNCSSIAASTQKFCPHFTHAWTSCNGARDECFTLTEKEPADLEKAWLRDPWPVSLIAVPATWISSIIISSCWSNEVYYKMNWLGISHSLLNHKLQCLKQLIFLDFITHDLNIKMLMYCLKSRYSLLPCGDEMCRHWR